MDLGRYDWAYWFGYGSLGAYGLMNREYASLLNFTNRRKLTLNAKPVAHRSVTKDLVDFQRSFWPQNCLLPVLIFNQSLHRLLYPYPHDFDSLRC